MLSPEDGEHVRGDAHLRELHERGVYLFLKPLAVERGLVAPNAGKRSRRPTPYRCDPDRPLVVAASRMPKTRQ